MQPQQAQLNYFWVLDNEVSVETLSAYQQALSGKKKSSCLPNWVSLLQAKVPIPARAYLTTAFLELADRKPGSDFFNELGFILERLERLSRNQLAGTEHPLLLTVQGDYCGTIRNIGVCPESLPALVHLYGEAQTYAVYVDFLESFSALALSCPHTDFRTVFRISFDREKGIDGLKNLSQTEFLKKVKEYQNLVSQKIGRAFPETPEQHLISSLVYAAKTAKSTQGDEIFIYVQYHRSQFGQSTQGVAYTRNPFTGKKDLYGVFAMGADGKKGPLERSHAVNGEESAPSEKGRSLNEKFPSTCAAIKRYLPKIEASFHEVMEANFVTDEDGNLHFTSFDQAQTTARASLVSTIDLNHEGQITDREAALRIKARDIETLLHPTLDEGSRAKLKDLGSTGVTAAPGTAVGCVFFKMSDAIEFHKSAEGGKKGKKVILVADELLISDTPGIGLISGLVTKTSGIASHAAVMARANGIPCVVGYDGLEFVEHPTTATIGCKINGTTLKSGAVITLDAGATGKIYAGEGTLENLSFQEGVMKDVSVLISRVIQQEKIPMEVRVNINNAKDAQVGLSFGADGVGLCRTENMFMEPEALKEIRNIVFTQKPEGCAESFRILEETQYQDFRKIFEVMRGRVVNIRLMDLPLHDFVPQTEEAFKELAKQLSHIDQEQLRTASEGLREHNPMLGLRACRFGLITPEVYDMQIRAIVRAAYNVAEQKVPVNPGIMFPLVFTEAELTKLKSRVIEIEEKIREELKLPFSSKVHFRVGSMIELPAAALSSDQLARVGEFFAFGTNDLTQTTLGMSRDDSAHYLPMYLEKGFLKSDPFKVLASPVRELILTAVQRGRRVRPDSSFGICGEQGGDATTLEFCIANGLNYVSCSPFRVLPARASLVQVALSQGRSEEKKTADKNSAMSAQHIQPRAAA